MSSATSGGSARLPPDGPAAPVVVLDPALWQALAADSVGPAFATAWLTLQCRALGRAERGVLVLRDGTGKLVPGARWPEGDGGSPALAAAAERAVEHAKGVASGAARSDGTRVEVLAYPLVIDRTLAAVVAVECIPAGEAATREAMRQLQWGLGTVEAVFRRHAMAAQETRFASLTAALEIAASTLTQPRFEDSARTFATELANRTGATRVAVGWRRGHAVRVVALSHGIGFSRRMDAVRAVAHAMEEALDQECSVAVPAPEEAGALVTAAHRHLSAAQRGGAVLTVPLLADDRLVGAVTLQFPPDAACTQAHVELVEASGALLAPILATQHRAERWLATQAWDIVRREAGHLVGPAHVGLKLGVAAAVALIAFFALFTTEYRVTARATVEGEMRRTIAAALDGYLASEHARAGHVVHKGDVLATLDGGELMLQRLRWVAQREQRRLELDKALAAGQRAEVNINQAQINEATAQIALLDEQIARTRIVAPFDGLILSGDLSQSVGAAVQRAQVLFEIAPLDAYRVIARVPDADIGDLRPGQAGALVLSALPDDRYTLEVTAITPVAEVSDGSNAFKVEARVQGNVDRLRPNMEGVAKIEVGTHHLIWIWTHHMIAAARLWLWSWWP